MASNVPADPSVQILVQHHCITPLSVPRANDITRLHVTPRSMHRDDPVPPAAPGFPVPNPANVDIDHPPLAVMNMVAVAGITEPIRQLVAAQALMYLQEHFSCRTVHASLSHRQEFALQRLHSVYNTFTKGMVAYACYCVGRGSWNSQISVASKSVALLEGYNDVALDFADRFGRLIVGLWPELDRGIGNNWYYLALDWDTGEDCLRDYDLHGFFKNQVNRYRDGGIHSAAWIADQIHRQRRLSRNCTKGLLYQHVVIMGRMTSRLNLIRNGTRWRVTDDQAGVLANLPNCKAYPV